MFAASNTFNAQRDAARETDSLRTAVQRTTLHDPFPPPKSHALMSTAFFDKPILNSPYERPGRHWELDDEGQPTQRIVESRRRAEFITPIP
ncbi:MAG TPA: hypothetical protein VF035_05095, partial [Longimicrobiales bacterium]